MRTSLFVGACGGLALASGFLLGAQALAQEQVLPRTETVVAQEGVEVLTRGPVHEAFAEPAIRGPRPSALVPKKPPDLIEELPPEQKPEGANVQWLPGYWAWDNESNDYLWVSGIWRDVPPGRQWTPGHWSQGESGWQWVPGFWLAQDQSALEFLPQPPDPVAEAPSPAPNDSAVFVPGCWVYHDHYVWRPGFWITRRLGWLWTPAYYVWTPGGYLFVEGFWDYPLRERGLLFACALIDRAYLARPGWTYQPTFVVNEDFLLNSLFVRANTCHYYFGDYFGANYARLGFVPWVDFRYGQRHYDPLYSYYRWQHRSDPAWEKGLRASYEVHQGNEGKRLPHTLAQQNAWLRDQTAQKTGATAKNVRAVTALSALDLSHVALQPVPKALRTEERTSAQQLRSLSQQRAQIEAQAQAHHATTGRAADNYQPFKIEVPGRPKPRAAIAPAGVKAPPPAPTFPKPEAQPSQRAPGVERGETPSQPAVRPEPRTAPKPEPTRPPVSAPATPLPKQETPRPSAPPQPMPTPQATPPRPVAPPQATPAPRAEPPKPPKDHPKP